VGRKEKDSKAVEKNGHLEDKRAGNGADRESNVLGKKDDSSLGESETRVEVDRTDKHAAEESPTTPAANKEVNGEVTLTQIEKLDEPVAVGEQRVADEDHAEGRARQDEVSPEDSSSREKQDKGGCLSSVEGGANDNSKTPVVSVTGNEKQTEVHELVNGVGDIGGVVENEVKGETVDEIEKHDESPKSAEVQESEPSHIREAVTDEVPKIKEESEVSDGKQTPDLPDSGERDVEAELVVEQKLETTPLESDVPAEISHGVEKAGADDESTGKGISTPDEELVILEELPEIALVLEAETDASGLADEIGEKESKSKTTHEEAPIVSEEVTTQLESGVDGVPQSSDKGPDEIPPVVAEARESVSPNASPKKSKFSTKPDEADTKSGKRRTKSNVSRTRSDESGTKNERLRAKSDVSGSKSSEVGTKDDERESDVSRSKSSEVGTKDDEGKHDVSRSKSSEVGTKDDERESDVSRSKSSEVATKDDEGERNENTSPAKSDLGRTKSAELATKGTDKVSKKSGVARTRSAESGTKDSEDGAKAGETGTKTSKPKLSDDAWKKNVRKKRGVPDVDRAAELNVLGRSGKLKNKLKSCETRDVESAEQWKREVKKSPRKHKSFDEETEKELRELSRKRDLKNIVQSCEEKEKESAETWKREVSHDYFWSLTYGLDRTY
jgi:hypothetical protein